MSYIKSLHMAVAKKKISKPASSASRKARESAETISPDAIEPMLATLVDKPFEEEGWTYELKWDGYRAMAFVNNGDVQLRSRNNKSFNEKFYPVYEALKKWKMNVV